MLLTSSLVYYNNILCKKYCIMDMIIIPCYLHEIRLIEHAIVSLSLSLAIYTKEYNQWLFIVTIWIIADFSLFLLPSYNNKNPFLDNKCASWLGKFLITIVQFQNNARNIDILCYDKKTSRRTKMVILKTIKIRKTYWENTWTFVAKYLRNFI